MKPKRFRIPRKMKKHISKMEIQHQPVETMCTSSHLNTVKVHTTTRVIVKSKRHLKHASRLATRILREQMQRIYIALQRQIDEELINNLYESKFRVGIHSELRPIQYQPLRPPSLQSPHNIQFHLYPTQITLKPWAAL